MIQNKSKFQKDTKCEKKYSKEEIKCEKSQNREQHQNCNKDSKIHGKNKYKDKLEE